MVSPENSLLDIGYNGFPRGSNDDLEFYMNAEYKANNIVHAEMNCIYNAAAKGISLRGATAFIYGLRPCSRCSLAMRSIGISNVVFSNLYGSDPKWNSDWEISRPILEAGNIPWRELLAWE